MTQETITMSQHSTVEELWAAYERQKQELDELGAEHTALCEQAGAVHEAFTASAAKLRELFDVAYEAEFGRKYDPTADRLAALTYS